MTLPPQLVVDRPLRFQSHTKNNTIMSFSSRNFIPLSIVYFVQKILGIIPKYFYFVSSKTSVVFPKRS